jgi:hypothetical protein
MVDLVTEESIKAAMHQLPTVANDYSAIRTTE